MRLSQWILLPGLFLALIITGALPAQAQSGIVTTTNADLSLRVGAGTEWRLLEIMPQGTAVALDGRTSNNLWVRGITSGGSVGWMLAQYVNVTPDQVASLPVIARTAPITVPAPAPNPDVNQIGGGDDQPAPAPQSDAPPSSSSSSDGATATVTANLNVRSGPDTSFRRVGGFSAGEQIRIDGRDPSIGWLRAANSAGVVGWVSADYVNLNFDQKAALPIVEVGSPFRFDLPAQAGSGGGDTQAAAEPPAASDVQPVVSTAPVTGFAYGGHVRPFDERTVNYMRQAGMTWVKKQVRYNQGDDPNGVAGIINDAHAKGFRIMLGVVGSPSQLNNPGYYDQYAAFVGGLAALGADAIEVWNEMNIDREWPTGQIDPGAYTNLLARAYNAIKSANSNTLVISGAPAPTGFVGGCTPNGCDDAPYIRGMAAAGAANYADCIGVHYNEGIVPPTQNSNDPRGDSYYTRFYRGMVDTYYNAFGGRRPLCFTELGYLSGEGYPPLPGAFGWAQNVTVAQQAAWLDQVVDLARRSGIVRLLIIWNVDFREYGADPMAGYAIIRPDGSCPACAALGN